MIILDHEKIINERLNELLSLDCYIPLCLHCYLDDTYFDRASEQALNEYYQKRTELQCTNDKGRYMKDDLMKWLDEHKEFKDIIQYG